MSTSNMFLKDYLFKGIQQQQAKMLSDFFIDDSSKSKIFNSTAELFMAAALVGCYNNKKVKPDKGETRRIMNEQLTSRYDDLMYIYRLVMLTNESVEKSTDRINNAFRNLDDDKNWDLFEEYVLGGLQVLYENFFPNNDSAEKNNYDDYFDNLYAMLKVFKENDLKEEAVIDLTGE